jgi:hypothetical protein
MKKADIAYLAAGIACAGFLPVLVFGFYIDDVYGKTFGNAPGGTRVGAVVLIWLFPLLWTAVIAYWWHTPNREEAARRASLAKAFFLVQSLNVATHL